MSAAIKHTFTGITANINPVQRAPQRNRKQRTVYGAYTDIDNIAITPGIEYQNWIAITKTKLKEREAKLMEIRLNCAKKAIINAVHEFQSSNSNIKSISGINVDCVRFEEIEKTINMDMIKTCMQSIEAVLRLWTGINLNRSNKVFLKFRQYFIVAKNWFDQRKKEILAQYFWSKMFIEAQEFCDKLASEYFCGALPNYQRQYSKALMLKILTKILTSKTNFVATKAQPLIPGGTIKDTKDIKYFFVKNIDPSLDVKVLIQGSNEICNETELSAKKTLKLVIDKLNILSIESELILQKSIAILYNKPNYIGNKSIPSTNSNSVICVNSTNNKNDIINVDDIEQDKQNRQNIFSQIIANRTRVRPPTTNCIQSNDVNGSSSVSYPDCKLCNNTKNISYQENKPNNPFSLSIHFAPNQTNNNHNNYNNNNNNNNIYNNQSYLHGIPININNNHYNMNAFNNNNNNHNSNSNGYYGVHYGSYHVSDGRYNPIRYKQSNQCIHCNQCNQINPFNQWTDTFC